MTIGAMITSWSLRHVLPSPLVLGWLGLLIIANIISSRRVQPYTGPVSGRAPASVASTGIIIDNYVRALLWVSIPTYGMAMLGGIDQMTVILATAVMMCAALALAVVPVVALGWIAILGFGMVAGLIRAPIALPAATLYLFTLVTCFAIGGALILGRILVSGVQELAIMSERGTAANNLLREYEERGGSWLWQTDTNNALVFVSPQLGLLLNRSTRTLVGQTLPAVFRGHAALAAALNSRQDFMGIELELQTADGKRWFALSGSAMNDKSRAFNGFRGVGVDITESKLAQQKLQHLANLDTLTGLPNRQRVRELLGEALHKATEDGSSCAVLFLDLDGFKPVNDSYGHAKGDVVLRTVARRLQLEIGEIGAVGRIGGDEFAVVLHDAHSRRHVETLAQRIIDTISAPYQVDELSVRIGLSIGCAYGPIDADNVDELIQKADFALYNAKADGRGACRAFEPSMQHAAEERISLENDIRAAIGTDQFYVAYQPQVDSETHVITGFEALLRWQHPTRGFISPATFIPIAEESGLIVQLGEWVLKTACADAARWPGHISVAINVSPVQLLHPTLPNAVAEALGRARLPANRLELEVTESVFLGDSDYSLNVLKRLRDLGVSIALDDFGTGYSSLGYLNKAVFHKLKIDGSFVRDAATNEESVAIIRAMVSLAAAFRMSVTAECVETKEDLTRMKSLGCHQIQGYLFGRPMKQEKTLELLVAAQGNARHRAA
jgi:diguanylate cyclase (GGDEF)-like protein